METKIQLFIGYMSNSFQVLLQALSEKITAGRDSPFRKRVVIVPDKYSKAALQIGLTHYLPQKAIFGTAFLLPHETMSVTFQECLSRALKTGHGEKRAVSLFLSCLYDLSEKADYLDHVERSGDTLENYEEIHLFNFSALCLSFHQRLISLSCSVPVTYYINSPCMLFWSDIASDREARRLERIDNPGLQAALRPLLYNRSRLLANNASLAREFNELLETSVEGFNEKYVVSEWVTRDPCYSQYLRPEIEINAAKVAPTLLELVQAELLLLGPKREEKIAFSSADKSVQFHKTPTLFREVELLYKNIQEFVVSAPTLSPESVVVLAPDIELYRPYIESLFTHSSQVLGKRKEEIFPCFLSILELPIESFQPARLFELFKTPAFRKKAGLELEDLSPLAACLQRLGYQLDLESCIEKVIATWVTSKNDGLSFASSDAQSIASALFTIRQLTRDLKDLLSHEVRPIAEWVKLLRALLETYFVQEAELETEQAVLLHLAKSAQSAHLEKATFSEIKRLLCEAVEAVRATRPESVYSPIVFATLGEYLPRSSALICFLGMNEEAFPRNSKTSICLHGFLLSDKLPLRVAAIERHLLLSALLAAQERLILSCQSYSFADRLELPIASFLQDLLLTLDETCTVEGELPSSKLVHTHALDSLKPENSLELSQVFTKGSKSIPERLFVHELSQVAKYPLRPYFQHNFGLYLRDFDTQLAKSEFETHDAMAFSSLRKESLFVSNSDAKLLGERNFSALPPLLKAALQARLDGDRELLQENAKSMDICLGEVLQIELTSTCKKPVQIGANSWKVPALDFDLAGTRIMLEGRLVNLHPQGLLLLGAKSKEAIFRSWPEVLLGAALAALYPVELAFQSRFLFLKDAKSETVEIDDPIERLTQYVAYALECREEAFCLYPDWIEKLRNSDEHVFSLKQAPFLARDPYLDYYLSRLTEASLVENWPKWRQKALLLFGGG